MSPTQPSCVSRQDKTPLDNDIEPKIRQRDELKAPGEKTGPEAFQSIKIFAPSVFGEANHKSVATRRNAAPVYGFKRPMGTDDDSDRKEDTSHASKTDK